jgi:hypothetical protein
MGIVETMHRRKHSWERCGFVGTLELCHRLFDMSFARFLLAILKLNGRSGLVFFLDFPQYSASVLLLEK